MRNGPLLIASLCLWTFVISTSCSLSGEVRDPDQVTVPSAPAPPASAHPGLEENRGAINPRTGEYLPPSGRGVINPKTGDYYFPSGSGYFNPRTGEFIPKKP